MVFKVCKLRHFLKDILEPFSYLIYAIAVFVSLNRGKSIMRRVLFGYYMLSTFLLIAACYTKEDSINKLIYNIFFFITICLISYYFKSILFNRMKRHIINFLLVINVMLFIRSDLVFHQLFEYNTEVYGITFLSIVIYALFYFDEVIRNVNELNLLHQFNFWLVSGYLLYFLSSFFIILFYYEVDIANRASLWSLQNFILFLSSLNTIVGSLWINYQKKL